MKNININLELLLLTVVALVLIPQVSVYGSYLSRTGITFLSKYPDFVGSKIFSSDIKYRI